MGTLYKHLTMMGECLTCGTWHKAVLTKEADTEKNRLWCGMDHTKYEMIDHLNKDGQKCEGSKKTPKWVFT